MMLDGRHRWDEGVQKGAAITYTCRACGRTEVVETLIPDSVIDALTRAVFRGNPYAFVITSKHA